MRLPAAASAILDFKVRKLVNILVVVGRTGASDSSLLRLIRYGLVVDICADLRTIDLKDDNPCKVTLFVFGMAEAVLKSATPSSNCVYIVAELIYLIALRGNVVAMVSTKRIVCIVILNGLPTG
jgi:hypothetical protein